mgnify:CR=1 FL=1
MVKVRSDKELELMRESGRITALALRKVLLNIKVGVSGLELDKIAEEEIKAKGGQASFKTVEGYKWTICITINEEVVHGIPTERKLENGDLVGIDLGTVYKGWHTDAAWSVLVQSSNFKVKNYEEKEKFLKVGEEAMWAGVKQAVEGKRIGDISAAIQGKVEGNGYSIVRSLIGHGVGRELHEEPEVPGFGIAHRGMELKTGMTLAIEAIYNMGSYEVELAKDNWTYSSADRSLAGLFEMSVIVGKKEAKVLTDWRKVKGL